MLPDTFLQNSDTFLREIKPPNDAFDKDSTNLSQDIWNKFNKEKQTLWDFLKRIHLWKRLNDHIKKYYPQCDLFIAGSSVNGFCLSTSDVDITIFEKDLYSSPVSRHTALYRLTLIKECLEKFDSSWKFELITAIVPILQYKADITVDLNYNNLINIRNTYLLHCYSQVDWRIKPLAMMIKLWAKRQGINDPRYGTLSSYAVILMIIHFLQCGVKPALLPCLQNIFKIHFYANSDISDINFFAKLDTSLYNLVSNNMNLGSLLLRFFEYYSKFDFNHSVISVRLGTIIPRSQYQINCPDTLSYNHTKYIFVEEPFSLNNVSRTVHQYANFEKIKRILLMTYKTLEKNHNLASIFQQF